MGSLCTVHTCLSHHCRHGSLQPNTKCWGSFSQFILQLLCRSNLKATRHWCFGPSNGTFQPLESPLLPLCAVGLDEWPSGTPRNPGAPLLESLHFPLRKAHITDVVFLDDAQSSFILSLCHCPPYLSPSPCVHVCVPLCARTRASCSIRMNPRNTHLHTRPCAHTHARMFAQTPPAYIHMYARLHTHPFP